MPSTSTRTDWRTPTAVLICSGLVLTLAMGIRHGFGLFLQPMTADLHWSRETFALALAVQNLVWGATQPFAGMLADKYGSGRVVLGGALLYVLGLALMAHPGTPWQFVLSAGVLIGIGLSGVTFSVISGVLGRAYPPEKRSMALGISAAAGSAGQFAILPFTQWLLSNVGWQGALIALSAVGLLMAPLAAAMVERGERKAHTFQQSAGEAMTEALGHRGYMLLTIGFFVCGFQVVFVGVHLPAYLADHGLAPHVAVMALAPLAVNITSRVRASRPAVTATNARSLSGSRLRDNAVRSRSWRAARSEMRSGPSRASTDSSEYCVTRSPEGAIASS